MDPAVTAAIITAVAMILVAVISLHSRSSPAPPPKPPGPLAVRSTPRGSVDRYNAEGGSPPPSDGETPPTFPPRTSDLIRKLPDDMTKGSSPSHPEEHDPARSFIATPDPLNIYEGRTGSDLEGQFVTDVVLFARDGDKIQFGEVDERD
jgi:hypothetical protein